MEKFQYSAALEDAIEEKSVTQEVRELFKEFLAEKGIELERKSELYTLRAIKSFLHRQKERREAITQNSLLSESDCNTMAAIACILVGDYGFNTQIGSPKELKRMLHAVLVDSRGRIFKITGKKRSKAVKILSPQKVRQRLILTKPIITGVNRAKESLGLRKKIA